MREKVLEYLDVNYDELKTKIDGFVNAVFVDNPPRIVVRANLINEKIDDIFYKDIKIPLEVKTIGVVVVEETDNVSTSFRPKSVVISEDKASFFDELKKTNNKDEYKKWLKRHKNVVIT